MLSKDFKYRIYLTGLFAAGSVSEIFSLIGRDNHLSNFFYMISLILVIFNYSTMVKEKYLWKYTFYIIGMISLIQIIFIYSEFKSVIINNVFSVISLIVWIISVNYLSNHHRNKEE